MWLKSELIFEGQNMVKFMFYLQEILQHLCSSSEFSVSKNVLHAFYICAGNPCRNSPLKMSILSQRMDAQSYPQTDILVFMASLTIYVYSTLLFEIEDFEVQLNSDTLTTRKYSATFTIQNMNRNKSIY